MEFIIHLGMTFLSLIIIAYVVLVLYFIINLFCDHPEIMVSVFGWICLIGVLGYVGYELNKKSIMVTEYHNGTWQSEMVNTGDWSITNTNYQWSSNDTEILAEGVCVDKAQTIVNILKRRYKEYDRIRIADAPAHVQAVRLNENGKIDFLDLDGVDIIIGHNEFKHHDGKFRLIDPDQFLEAIAIFKPDLTNPQLNYYLSK